jgi:23S rRNA maturation mini-RNase III
MDFYKVPMGFGMALSMNPFALNAYSALTEEEKVEILKRAHNAKSEQEMRQIVDGIAK